MKLCECGASIEDISKMCSSCHCRAVNQNRARQQAKAKKAGQLLADHNRAKASGLGYVKANGLDKHLHRQVAERVLGRALLPGEVVHHEDRNKQNNDPSNLIVFVSQAEHAKHHAHEDAPCACNGTRLKEVRPNVQ